MSGVFGIDEVEFSDSWLLAEEISALFSSIYLYHTPVQFRSVKHSVSLLEGSAKQADIIRVPLVFHTPEDLLFCSEPGALISLHTFGRVVGPVNNSASLIVEELGPKGEAKESIIRMSTNGTASCFLLSAAGYGLIIALNF